MSAACSTDGSFGPGVGSCRGGFDFTLGFEDSVLGLLPQAALLLLAPIRLATLRRRHNKVARYSHLGFLKTVSPGCSFFCSSMNPCVEEKCIAIETANADAFERSLEYATSSLRSFSWRYGAKSMRSRPTCQLPRQLWSFWAPCSSSRCPSWSIAGLYAQASCCNCSC